MRVGSAHLLSGYFQSNHGLLAIPQSTAVILGGNVNRVSLLFSNGSGSSVYLGFDGNISAGLGITIAGGSVPFVMTVKDWPGLIGQEIYGIAGGPGVQVYYVELLEKEPPGG